MSMNDRRGNPSDPDEEAERVRKALANVQNWQNKYGAEFSGGVSMQMGSGKKYEVPIGDREIAQKVVSRPLPAPDSILALPPAAYSATTHDFAGEMIPCEIKLRRSWFNRMFDWLFGEKI
jgi:hypothetical protein